MARLSAGGVSSDVDRLHSRIWTRVDFRDTIFCPVAVLYSEHISCAKMGTLVSLVFLANLEGVRRYAAAETAPTSVDMQALGLKLPQRKVSYAGLLHMLDCLEVASD